MLATEFRVATSPVIASPVLRRLLPAFALSAVGDGMSAVGVAWLAIRIAPPADRDLVVGVAVAAYTLPGAAGAVLLARPLRALAARHLVAADAALRAVTLSVIPLLYAFGARPGRAAGRVLVLHAWACPAATVAGLHRTPPMPSFAILAVAAATARGHPRTTGPADAGQPGRARGFAVIARSRPLAGLLALTVAFFFLYGPVEVALPLYVTGPLRGSAALLGLFWTVFGIGATAGSIIAGLTRRLPVWPVLVAAVIGWGAALAPLGLLRLPVPALACFAAGGLLYAPYPALSASLFQRESPAELLSQVLAARGALTVLATPLGTALGGPLTAWLGAQHTLLVSAAATIASGLAATALLTTQRRNQAGARMRRGSAVSPQRDRLRMR